MSDEFGLDDIATLGLSAVVDWDLKRKGKYKKDIRNKVSSVAGSVWLGAVGTTVGGPALGVIMGGLGHVVGQSVEFGCQSEEGPKQKETNYLPLNLDYDNTSGKLFDYDSF